MNQALVYTKVARKAIREHLGKDYIFLATNKYDACRTVKTYARDLKGTLRAHVAAALFEAGCTEFSIKVRKFYGYGCDQYSFIVRLPHNEPTSGNFNQEKINRLTDR